ncbi:unnamed protein product [Musa acuminata subsp. malaccensis]|uniref:(wild Malaysian banana) hypothetical protein n=1 Tax=Musa acuminata subsp. malaccensis TaxID=214687 RepID=A0A804KFB5_MUSAM|nr:unnamed protein product [Musa acuminata subsp. malaccensis]
MAGCDDESRRRLMMTKRNATRRRRRSGGRRSWNRAVVAVGGSPGEGDGQKFGRKLEEIKDKNQVDDEDKKRCTMIDRFQENGRGRHRRKLRDPKDERAWVHDGLKEMNLHETHNSETHF